MGLAQYPKQAERSGVAAAARSRSCQQGRPLQGPVGSSNRKQSRQAATKEQQAASQARDKTHHVGQCPGLQRKAPQPQVCQRGGRVQEGRQCRLQPRSVPLLCGNRAQRQSEKALGKRLGTGEQLQQQPPRARPAASAPKVPPLDLAREAHEVRARGHSVQATRCQNISTLMAAPHPPREGSRPALPAGQQPAPCARR